MYVSEYKLWHLAFFVAYFFFTFLTLFWGQIYLGVMGVQCAPKLIQNKILTHYIIYLNGWRVTLNYYDLQFNVE